MNRLRQSIVILGALLLAGCTGSGTPTPGPTATGLPSVQPEPAATSTPATTSPPAVPSSTPLSFVEPTHVTFTPSTGPAPETWDLVALGDSNVSGWGVRPDAAFSPEAAYPGVYAQLLAEEQGVNVQLHSYYPDQPGNEVRTITGWTQVLQLDPQMRADLRQAELVTVLIGYHDLLPVLLFGSCPDDLAAFRSCMLDITGSMPSAFTGLYQEIASLVPPGTTVLVNDYGIPMPVYARYASLPDWDARRKALFEDWRASLEDAATGQGFIVVHTYRALNEEDGRPRDFGEPVTSDGWHFNDLGHRVVAEAVLAADLIEKP